MLHIEKLDVFQLYEKLELFSTIRHCYETPRMNTTQNCTCYLYKTIHNHKSEFPILLLKTYQHSTECTHGLDTYSQ